jgi:hypothetical protein
MLFAVFCLVLAGGTPQASSSTAQPAPGGVTVSGRLLAEWGKSLVSGTVVISSPRRGERTREAATEALMLPDGTFVFREVPPGDYLVRARARTERGGVSLFATFALAVRSRDVEHVDLVLKPGAIMQGEVVIESRHGSAPPPIQRLRIRAPLPNGSSFGDARGAAVRSDRSFSLDGVMAGTHVLTVEGLPFPWRIIEARILGQNAAERAFDVEARQQIRGIRIVLADTAAGVSGEVRLPTQARLALDEVLVVAFPADPLRRALPLRFVKVARPGSDGSYRIVDLAADDYRVIAAAGITARDAMDPEMLGRWMDASTPVKLAETQMTAVPLTAIFAPGTSTVP